LKYVPAIVVAEIGCVHIGSLDRAKELALLAKLCGADYVKLQKRNPTDSVPLSMQAQPHPNQLFSYGDTYLEHRIALELSIEDHIKLKEYCDSIGIGYSSSVWDVVSAREIISLNPDFIKIPSACNASKNLLEIVANEYQGDIHVSTGMTTTEEKADLYEMISSMDLKDRVVIYHCTSEYPCSFDHLYLREIERIKWAPAKKVGFSNHGYGISADIVAYTLGAQWIERHFVDDRTFRHTDASASLEPDGLRRLCRDLKAVYKALRHKDSDITEEEAKQRAKLRIDDD
jgi:N-acetylneuraminate synthase